MFLPSLGWSKYSCGTWSGSLVVAEHVAQLLRGGLGRNSRGSISRRDVLWRLNDVFGRNQASRPSNPNRICLFQNKESKNMLATKRGWRPSSVFLHLHQSTCTHEHRPQRWDLSDTLCNYISRSNNTDYPQTNNHLDGILRVWFDEEKKGSESRAGKNKPKSASSSSSVYIWGERASSCPHV